METIDNLKSITSIKDEECEAVVLSGMIGNTYKHDEAREIITEDCFTVKEYREIFKALQTLDNRGDAINTISLNLELRKSGHEDMSAFLMELWISHHSEISILNQARFLRELDIRRKSWGALYGKLNQIADLNEDIYEVLTGVSDSAHDLLKGFSGSNVTTLHDADASLLRQIEANMNESGEITGTPTGFHKIDSRGGLQAGSLIIIAAETSQGKTSFSLALAKNAVQKDFKIAFYSMEMTMNEIAARIAAMQSGVSSSRLLYEKLPDTDLNHVMEYCSLDFKRNFFLDDTSTSSLDKIIVSIRSLKIKHDISGAFIDYLQMLNVNTKTMNKEQAMADAARRLKNLAKELGIWIVALSQLNRNQDNPVPTLNRLRDSGQIAEAADMVIFIYRPQYYNRSYPEPFQNVEPKGTALIDVAKGRNTGVFKFIANFDAPTTHFRDYNDFEYPEKEDKDPF